MQLRAIRGAITCDDDNQGEIETKTQRLLLEMLARNEVEHEDIVSVIFTATSDLHSHFPATAARGIGFGDIPLLGAQEIEVEGALPRTIRILMHCYSERSRDDMRHVFLDGAQVLRTDIPQ